MMRGRVSSTYSPRPVESITAPTAGQAISHAMYQVELDGHTFVDRVVVGARVYDRFRSECGSGSGGAVDLRHEGIRVTRPRYPEGRTEPCRIELQDGGGLTLGIFHWEPPPRGLLDLLETLDWIT